MDYSDEEGLIMARIMVQIYEQATTKGVAFLMKHAEHYKQFAQKAYNEYQFGQQYPFEKGMKIFGSKGKEAAVTELDQLHRRVCFTPVDVSTLTKEERIKAQIAIMLLTQKSSGEVKGRCVYNGKQTRNWLSREDTTSPTVLQEGLFITGTIDAKEGRDMMSSDIPNAFIQAKVPADKTANERIIMKITGRMIDYLIEIAPDVYSKYVVYENGKRVLYVQVLRALYGMLISAILWYNKLRKDLEEIGFDFNPYDPCIANRIVKKKQQTVRFHVDDLLSSHVNTRVNDLFLKWLIHKYGEHGKVKSTRGKVHEFLGMTLDFRTKGKMIVDMTKYMKNMYEDFEKKYVLNGTMSTPAGSDLFVHDDTSPKLDAAMREDFHTFTAKGLFACKRARPDTATVISVLSTRVRNPTVNDWKKLVRYMKYVKKTWKDVLTLSADDLHVVKWYVDASFAVHPDFKSHSGAIMTMGEGTTQSVCSKQKLNTRSSTIAELVSCDDAITKILWTRLFMEAQGYEIKENILYQDNKSTIVLIENGRKSAGKRTRAINIRYFFINDQIEKGHVSVKYCPTKEMWADPMTKPLQGSEFQLGADRLMGRTKT